MSLDVNFANRDVCDVIFEDYVTGVPVPVIVTGKQIGRASCRERV